MHRRHFLSAFAAAVVGTPQAVLGSGPRLSAAGQGDVKTPTFYRYDIGTASDRLHEPSADDGGNLWTSPLDGTLWRYHTPTGRLEILDLQRITGRSWKGLHLWPVAHGPEVYLCCPSLPQLWVYQPKTQEVQKYALPHAQPQVYGGFSVPPGIYFYDTRQAALIAWDPQTHTGKHYPCPYRLSGTLYMTFADPQRREIWGSTYMGNDLVRFDLQTRKWTGHWKCPGNKATPTPANGFFGDTLYVSDHLNGRLIPFHVSNATWGEAIPIPGYRQWFGYVSGGWVFRNLIYFCHSTWTGGNHSLDGRPHRFLGSWTVFDPQTRKFSRLDIPARDNEDFMSDYAIIVREHLYLLAVNRNPPHNAVIVQTQLVPKPEPD
jgi:hypothetical protein